ncbi:unnamed protein product [Effrenium voratum]|nr:unnamed protein product [Effrenium voratum]
MGHRVQGLKRNGVSAAFFTSRFRISLFQYLALNRDSFGGTQSTFGFVRIKGSNQFPCGLGHVWACRQTVTWSALHCVSAPWNDILLLAALLPIIFFLSLSLCLSFVLSLRFSCSLSLSLSFSFSLFFSSSAQVVTGVFCQSAIESAQNDHHAVVQSVLKNKEMHVNKLRNLFSEIGDATGIITFAEFERKINSPAVQAYFEVLGLDVSDAWSFFKLLDLDDGGDVEIEEFLMGCLRLRGTARAIDVGQLIHDQNWLIKNQGKFQTFVVAYLHKWHSRCRSSPFCIILQVCHLAKA